MLEFENTSDEAETTDPVDVIPDAIQAKLDEVFAGQDIDPDVDVDTGTPNVSPRELKRLEIVKQEQADELIEEGIINEDGEPVEPKLADEDKEASDDVAAKAATATADAAADQVDPNLRFAANQMGMTDEKIDRLFKADPELANETLTTLADSYLNLSRQYLETPGSPAISLGTRAAQQSPAQPTDAVSQLNALFAPEALAKFAEANGSDIVDKFLLPLKAEVLEPVQRMFAELEVQKQEVYRTEALAAMGTLEQKFQTFYGEGDKARSDVQEANRKNLGVIADQIRQASRNQGRELSIKDAINRAHLIVSADHREQIVRKDIKEQVQKRSRTITAKPTQRRDASTLASKSDDKAADAIHRWHADRGIDVPVNG